MDIIEKNMILKTNDTLLNYGALDSTGHTLNGIITSSTPFTFTVLGDNEQLIPLQYSIPQNPHKMSVNFQFTTGLVSKFQLQLEGADFDIQLKLWKPHPITEPIPNI